MNYQDRIVRDPQIVGGEPVLKGTRVTLKTVLASLAEGATTAEILAVPTDEHKAAALKRASVLPDAVFGNSMHDLQMLEMARDAYAVNPNTDLRRTAEGRGWVVFDPQTTM